MQPASPPSPHNGKACRAREGKRRPGHAARPRRSPWRNPPRPLPSSPGMMLGRARPRLPWRGQRRDYGLLRVAGLALLACSERQRAHVWGKRAFTPRPPSQHPQGATGQTGGLVGARLDLSAGCVGRPTAQSRFSIGCGFLIGEKTVDLLVKIVRPINKTADDERGHERARGWTASGGRGAWSECWRWALACAPACAKGSTCGPADVGTDG